jgi:hypothetical protein
MNLYLAFPKVTLLYSDKTYENDDKNESGKIFDFY